MVALQNNILKKLALISFLQVGKSSTSFKVLFKSLTFFFCLSDFAKHSEKLLILQTNHMTRCQTRAASFFYQMNTLMRLKMKRKVTFFIEYSRTNKSKYCCQPPFKTFVIHPPKLKATRYCDWPPFSLE